MNLLQIYDSAFSGITIDEIRKRIAIFKEHSASWGADEMRAFILDLAMGRVGYALTPRIPISRRSYPKNTNFIRVRNLKDEPEEKEFFIGDMWEAPAKYVNPGRLNARGEQFLYATEGQIKAPKLEVGIEEGDPYLLIFYKSTDDIELIDVGWQDETIPEYFGAHTEKAREILNFINTSFRKDEIYIISNSIAKEIHLGHFDGWCYPSAKLEGAINACFNLPAKDKLDFSGAFIARDLGDQQQTIAVCVDGDSGLALFSDWADQNSLAKKLYDEIWTDYMQTGDLADLKENNKSTDPEVIYILKPAP